MITEEAIKRIQETYHKYETIEKDGRTWEIYPQGMLFKEIIPHLVDCLRISTLSGLVKFIECFPDIAATKLFIHIAGIGQVCLISDPDPTYRRREYYIEAEAPTDWPEQREYASIERFIVYLMTHFENDENLVKLLGFLGSIKTEDVLQADDDGVSQQVTVKTGITTVAAATVPNPLELRPFISFPEIQPPKQLYIFRMKKGSDMNPLCSLTATASPIAHLAIIDRIREYLASKVKVDIIS